MKFPRRWLVHGDADGHGGFLEYIAVRTCHCPSSVTMTGAPKFPVIAITTSLDDDKAHHFFCYLALRVDPLSDGTLNDLPRPVNTCR